MAITPHYSWLGILQENSFPLEIMCVCQNGDVLGSREVKLLLDPRLSSSGWMHAVTAPRPRVPPRDGRAVDGRCWGDPLGIPVLAQGWGS